MNRLRRLPGGQWTGDVLLWLALAASLLPTYGRPRMVPDGLPLSWVKIAAVPLLAATVYFSRRKPPTVVAAPLGLGLAVTLELLNGPLSITQVVLAYVLGRRTAAGREPLVLFAALCAAGAGLLLASPDATTKDDRVLVVDVALTLVLPWLVGQFVRQRAELARSGWQLAERLTREQALASDRARLRERSRIASDMHDMLGHELSLIAVRAAALQVAEDVGPEGRLAAQRLRQDAASATRRLREVIGVLREEGESAPRQPTSESVRVLVARAAAAGVPVTLDDRLRGVPSVSPVSPVSDGSGSARSAPQPAASGPSVRTLARLASTGGDELPAMTSRAIHQVVKEALTNATKHAPGAPVTVSLRREGPQAVVSVRNGRPPVPPPPGSPEDRGPDDALGSHGSGGYGLVGLDERVRQAGGTLRAEPAEDGFAVTARLPLTGGGPARPPGTAARPNEHTLAQRTARRRMFQTVWLPAAAMVALLAVVISYRGHDGRRSVLDHQTYERLRIGQRQSVVEPFLPTEQLRPPHPPADPPGTDDCRLYGSTTNEPGPVYRLCFTDGRLSYKDVVNLRLTSSPD